MQAGDTAPVVHTLVFNGLTAGELHEQVEHLDAVALYLLLLGGVVPVDDDNQSSTSHSQGVPENKRFKPTNEERDNAQDLFFHDAGLLS